jgi:hypothetical protein
MGLKVWGYKCEGRESYEGSDSRERVYRREDSALRGVRGQVRSSTLPPFLPAPPSCDRHSRPPVSNPLQPSVTPAPRCAQPPPPANGNQPSSTLDSLPHPLDEPPFPLPHPLDDVPETHPGLFEPFDELGLPEGFDFGADRGEGGHGAGDAAFGREQGGGGREGRVGGGGGGEANGLDDGEIVLLGNITGG